MIRLPYLTPKLGLVALLAATMLPSPAFAGNQTQAEAAIAEAQGKIDAGDKVGAGQQVPELQQQARAALMNAQDLLSHHRKVDAITQAHRASELADQAIVQANGLKASAERDRRDALRDATASAQQSAANANIRAATAEQATSNANMRANSAEQSSAAANAQTEALRNATPQPVVTPSRTTVVVTDHEPAGAPTPHRHRIYHHPIRHHARPTHAKTTTTVTTTSPS